LPKSALGNPRQFDSRFDIELVEHVTKVSVDGVRRDEEPFGDFAVGFSIRSQLDNS
jgi:hypothetical protein